MMKKIIIILVCCFSSSLVIGQTKTYTGKFSNLLAPDYYALTDYKIPKPFGIILGQPLEKNTILKIIRDNLFYINPKVKNNIFDRYRVDTKLNNVVGVLATGDFNTVDECIYRRDYLLEKLATKYIEGTTKEDGSWIFIQAKEFEYSSKRSEWIAEFKIELYCNEKDLISFYWLYKGEPDKSGID